MHNGKSGVGIAGPRLVGNQFRCSEVESHLVRLLVMPYHSVGVCRIPEWGW
jgi:hypothetical protein